MMDSLRIRLAIAAARLVQRLLEDKCGHCAALAIELQDHVLVHARARGVSIAEPPQ